MIDVEFCEIPLLGVEAETGSAKRKKTRSSKVETSGAFVLGGRDYDREEGFQFSAKKANDFNAPEIFESPAGGVGEGFEM